MTHAELVALARDLAWERGLFVHCCLDGRRCEGPGLPDLIIAGPGGVLYREVKTRAAPKLRDDQKSWMAMLRASGQRVGVWEEVSFSTGWVESDLDSIRGQPAPSPTRPA